MIQAVRLMCDGPIGLDLPATLRSEEGRELPVTILDLTATGLTLRSPETLRRGCLAELTLDNGLSLEAVVEWSRGEEVGLTFAGNLLPLGHAPLAQRAGRRMEARAGIEPACKDLQSSA